MPATRRSRSTARLAKTNSKREDAAVFEENLPKDYVESAVPLGPPGDHVLNQLAELGWYSGQQAGATGGIAGGSIGSNAPPPQRTKLYCALKSRMTALIALRGVYCGLHMQCLDDRIIFKTFVFFQIKKREFKTNNIQL